MVDPPYPGSSAIPGQYIRKNTHPAMPGIAAIILIVFLGGLLWWNFGKTDRFPEDADTPPSALSSDPLQEDTDPILTLSTPALPEENTPPPFDPELASQSEYEPESETELMSIPSLPTNQQQGRHNRHDQPEITDDKPLSSYQPSAPVPSTRASAPVQKQPPPDMTEPDEIPTPIEATEHTRSTGRPASAPVAIDSRTAGPPWLGQMRLELENCLNLFCRERVRVRYCTRPWENLSECKGVSL
jgi:hypothetical protein